MTETMTRDAYKVDLPFGEHGDARVGPIVVEDDILLRMNGRGTQPGQFTGLWIKGRLWMSDTQAEWYDHSIAVGQIRRRGGRILINGLGIGMVVKAALDCPDVEHVDVVESNADVIALVGPHYESDRCTIHHADAYEQMKAWPTGTRWTVAWHDIWLDMCTDNLPEMARLNRSYGKRTDWQGCWGKEHTERLRAQGW